MARVTKDYSEFRDVTLNKRVGAFYDFCKTNDLSHADKVDALIEKLMQRFCDSLGESTFPSSKTVVMKSCVEGFLNDRGLTEIGIDLGANLTHTFETLIGLMIVKRYMSASFSLKKNTFQQAANYMTEQLKGCKIEFSATNYTDRLYKKRGNGFQRSKDFGQFNIDGVRFGPRDGLILQMSQSGSFYELAVLGLPKLDAFVHKGELTIVNDPPMQSSIFYAMVEGLTQRCGITFTQTMSEIESILSDPKLPEFCTLDDTIPPIRPVSREEQSRKITEERTKDIRKEIPNFGMWG